MQLGMIGLGRMGGSMVRRLLRSTCSNTNVVLLSVEGASPLAAGSKLARIGPRGRPATGRPLALGGRLRCYAFRESFQKS